MSSANDCERGLEPPKTCNTSINESIVYIDLLSFQLMTVKREWREWDLVKAAL
jgi:hypothetical protein